MPCPQAWLQEGSPVTRIGARDLFAIGGPTRGIKPQTTELLGSLGHANPSTTIRW
ncbi:hypothetical protein D4764_02G0002900 [Takifugu flavidus]|uniref:Uncharacterized protein n=1 Tax=Takifugu flavidus TaxID=433684 RepID=A0A5C6NKS4_9TELE|nr:hypothetical protein D4764_02G0002900 [Takifugu flavidus]